MACCQLAQCGEVNTVKGAKFVLLWLQVAFLCFAIPLMSATHNWLDTPCAMYTQFMGGTIGICACGNTGTGDVEVNACRQDQTVLRATASIEAIMLLQLLLAVSGCAQPAARFVPVGKFMALPFLWLLFLLLPNNFFSSVGFVSSLVGACFFPAQMLLVVDFMYKWNETWFESANAAKIRAPRGRKHLPWLVGLVVFAVVFLICALVLAIQLSSNYPTAGARWLVWTTFAVSLVLLIVSITAWCKHGVFLVSAGVVFFMQWLNWQTLPMAATDAQAFAPPFFLEFVAAFVTLILLIVYQGLSGKTELAAPTIKVELTSGADVEAASERNPHGLRAAKAAQDERTIAVAAAAGAAAATAAAPGAASGARVEPINAMDFGVQCLIHLTAAAYLTSIFAPNDSQASYITHIVTTSVSLALYGWVLIAPMVLTNRQFNY